MSEAESRRWKNGLFKAVKGRKIIDKRFSAAAAFAGSRSAKKSFGEIRLACRGWPAGSLRP